jgi:hypothetical protein
MKKSSQALYTRRPWREQRKSLPLDIIRRTPRNDVALAQDDRER